MATLTCAELTAAYFLQKDMFQDSARNAEYIAEVNAAKALIENTTAKIQPIVGDPKKKRSVRVFWNKFCNTTVQTSEPDYCTISGAEADAGCEDYEITQNANKSFTIDEANYETNNLNIEQVFADNMLKTKKAMDEKITQMLIASLGTFAGENLYTKAPGCAGVASPESWLTTYINAGYWTPELMKYFATVARINKFASPFLLDGSNLDATIWKAMMNAGNANGAGAANMVKLMKYYEDLVNMAVVADGKTYMIDRGNVAFVSRARWGSNTFANPIQEANGRKKFSEPSANIPGLVYDVYINETCSGPYTKHDVLVDANFDLLNAPANCNEGTGVLEFACGACPA